MKAYLAITSAMYERANRTHLLQKVHLLRAEDNEEATTHIEEWLDEAYPAPAYFDHTFDLHELEKVQIKGDVVAHEFTVSETPITIKPSTET